VESSRNPALPGATTTTAVGRVALRSTVHRVGAAAPDLPGDGERGAVTAPRASRKRAAARADASQPGAAEGAPDLSFEEVFLEGDDVPPTERSSALPDPVSDIKTVAAEAKPAEAEPAFLRDSGVMPIPGGASATMRSQPAPALTPADAGMKEEPAPEREAAASGPKPTAGHEEAAPDPFAGKSAAELLEVAKERLAKRDARGAVAACEAARKMAPDDADVIALSAWAKLSAGQADVKALAVELDELLRTNDKHVPARFYRAMLRKRLSEQAACVRDLRLVLELSPDHADAKRELAALEPSPTAKERPSLFGRLFKR
jgi:hypothetical protein